MTPLFTVMTSDGQKAETDDPSDVATDEPARRELVQCRGV